MFGTALGNMWGNAWGMLGTCRGLLRGTCGQPLEHVEDSFETCLKHDLDIVGTLLGMRLCSFDSVLAVVWGMLGTVWGQC